MTYVMAFTVGKDESAEREAVWVHCGKCSHEWVMGYAPMTAGVFSKLAKIPCPMCFAPSKHALMGKTPKPTSEGDPIAWLNNGDTGTSSLTIWQVMMDKRPEAGWRGPDVPHDPADFGRCYRLLQAMPSWRARMPEVAAKYPRWAPLVAAWDELTTLYEEELPSGTAPKLYAWIKELINGERRRA